MRLPKAPHASLDFTWDWADWLQPGEQIAAAAIAVVGVSLASPAPAVVAGVSGLTGAAVAGAAVVAWLAGGAAGAPASATCRVTTTQGRVDERTIALDIQER